LQVKYKKLKKEDSRKKDEIGDFSSINYNQRGMTPEEECLGSNLHCSRTFIMHVS
jgi:hypothetical protein